MAAERAAQQAEELRRQLEAKQKLQEELDSAAAIPGMPLADGDPVVAVATVPLLPPSSSMPEEPSTKRRCLLNAQRCSIFAMIFRADTYNKAAVL